MVAHRIKNDTKFRPWCETLFPDPLIIPESQHLPSLRDVLDLPGHAELREKVKDVIGHVGQMTDDDLAELWTTRCNDSKEVYVSKLNTLREVCDFGMSGLFA